AARKVLFPAERQLAIQEGAYLAPEGFFIDTKAEVHVGLLPPSSFARLVLRSQRSFCHNGTLAFGDLRTATMSLRAYSRQWCPASQRKAERPDRRGGHHTGGRSHGHRRLQSDILPGRW